MRPRGPARIALLALGLLLATPARADDGVSYPDPPKSRVTHRALEVAVGGTYLASFPRAIGDGGPIVQGGLVFWRRGGRVGEFTLDVAASLALGVNGPGLHLTAGPRAGVALNFEWLGLELKMGLAGLAQLAARSAGGFALWGQGGYVLRLGEQRRHRLKLLVNMRAGAYLAADPGNDLGLNAMALGLMLAYEWPL